VVADPPGEPGGNGSPRAPRRRRARGGAVRGGHCLPLLRFKAEKIEPAAQRAPEELMAASQEVNTRAALCAGSSDQLSSGNSDESSSETSPSESTSSESEETMKEPRLLHVVKIKSCMKHADPLRCGREAVAIADDAVIYNIEFFRHLGEALWLQKPGSMVKCDYCEADVAQTQGVMQGAEGRSRFAQESFACSGCRTPDVLLRRTFVFSTGATCSRRQFSQGALGRWQRPWLRRRNPLSSRRTVQDSMKRQAEAAETAQQEVGYARKLLERRACGPVSEAGSTELMGAVFG
jgi:hypothetical protein